MVALSTAQWTADRSGPILDLTVGDLLRATASRVQAIALVTGAAETAERRGGRMASCSSSPSGRHGRCSLALRPVSASRCGRTTSRNGIAGD
jgi:hypothetical protein